MAEEIVNVGYLRDPETKEIFLPQTHESLVTGLDDKINTTINTKINTLDGNATTVDDTSSSLEIINTVSEENGIISSTKKTLTEGASSKITITAPTSGTNAGKIVVDHANTTPVYEQNTVATTGYNTPKETDTLVVTGIVTDYGHVARVKVEPASNLIAADIKAPVTKTDDTTWNFRETGGDITIGEDVAKIPSLKGNTLVWNQLVGASISSVTLVSQHKYYTVVGGTKSIQTGTGSAISVTGGTDIVVDLTKMFGETIANSMTVEAFEKLFPNSYYPYCEGRLVNLGGYHVKWNQLYNTTVPTAETGHKYYLSEVVSSTKTSSISTTISYTSGSTNRMCIDLTMMFGQGSEPTLEEFEAMFPEEYYGYNAGTEMNIFDAIGDKKLGLESVGFNQWDEEWVNGYWSNNIFHPSQSQVCPKSFISCLPNTTYFFRRNGHPGVIGAYDSNKQLIEVMGAWSTSNISFTTPANAAFLMFYYDGTTYNHDICINISCDRDGTYEPYKKDTLDLDWIRNIEYTPDGSSTPEKLFPYGLLSAGSVHDEVTETKAIKRVGKVDMGTLTWIVRGSENKNFSASIEGRSTSVGNYVSSKYDYVGTVLGWGAFNNTTVGLYCKVRDDKVGVRSENTYESGSTFKTAMSGVILYYELETPIEIPLAEPHRMQYLVADHGTEQQLPINVSSVINAPFVGTFEYSNNFKSAVLDLLKIKGGRAININANYEVSAKITDDLENDHPDDKLISAAQAFVELNERNVHADIVSAVTSGTIVVTENTITDTAAPSTAPTRIGQQYIKTSSPRKVYIAVGTSSSSDWLQVGSE